MKRSFYLVAAITAVLTIAAAPALAKASNAVVLTAPYDGDSEETLCTGEGGCDVAADADRTTGRIVTSAERRSAMLTTEAGLAQATGGISGRTAARFRSRSVTALVTFRVNSAAASLFSDVPNDLARVTAESTFAVACSGCPGGSRFVASPMTLVDTDPATGAPESIEGVSFEVPLTLTLNPGEKFRGDARVELSVASQGRLNAGTLPSTIDRKAVAASDVTLTKIEFTR